MDISKIYRTNKESISINTRIPENLYIEYKKISLETNYPFNGLILFAMNYALKDTEKKSYKTSKTDIAINLRIPKETHTEYKRLKNNLNRSINSLIISAMYYFLENN